MIKDVFDSSGTLDLAVGRLELQREVCIPLQSSHSAISLSSRDQRYDEWREIWRTDDGEADMKFEVYAKNDIAAARRVLRQLALMSQALFDAHALEDQYGIKPRQWPDRV